MIRKLGKVQRDTLYRLIAQGWTEYEHLPKSGQVVMVLGNEYCTIARTGEVKPDKPSSLSE